MLINLEKKRGLIEVSGVDAEIFLQNQFSNDIKQIIENTMQNNAYCTPKGRVIAIIKVFHYKNNFYLDLPLNLVQKVINRLKMFVIISKVNILDVSEKILRFILVDKNANFDNFKGFYASIIGDRYFFIPDKKDWQKWLNKSKKSDYDYNNLLDIINSQPDITEQTSELFTPQMLNLDMPNVNAVSFKKGCYPGQEVVARLHYLSKKNKKRLIKLSTSLDNPINISDTICVDIDGTFNDAGQIISVACDKNKKICLAVFTLEYKDKKIFNKNNPNYFLYIYE